MHVVFEFLNNYPVLIVFILVGIGALVGRIKFGSISLGAVGVLFAGIGITAWGVAQGVTLEVPAPVGDVGLVIFAFSTGIIAGPSFFNAIKTAYPMMIAVALILIAAAAAGFAFGSFMGIDPVTIAGTFAGAMNNTPALAATGGSPEATVGYASAYIFGTIGAILVASMALAKRKKDTDSPEPIIDRAVRIDIEQPLTAGEVVLGHGNRVTFSRLRPPHGAEHKTVHADTVLTTGSIVNVVGPKDEVEAVIKELGHASSINLVMNRKEVDFRRIILSKPEHAERTIASLGLRERFDATVVRVRRGDVDFVGTDDFVLHQGDRLRVVGPTNKLTEVSQFLGDSERGMSDVNPVALGIGIAIGMLIGYIAIPMPWGGTFSLGIAAGTLILGLIMGRLGRVGKVVVSLPNTAASVLAEIGLLIFLAYAGTKAGSLFIQAIVSGEILRLMLLGVVITSIAMFGTYYVLRYMFKVGGTRLSGMIGGAQTTPALLAYANVRTDYDVRVALGYSLVYPSAMVVKILIAQVLVGL